MNPFARAGLMALGGIVVVLLVVVAAITLDDPLKGVSYQVHAAVDTPECYVATVLAPPGLPRETYDAIARRVMAGPRRVYARTVWVMDDTAAEALAGCWDKRDPATIPVSEDQYFSDHCVVMAQDGRSGLVLSHN